MPELLIELLSEEIPARMQARAAEDLRRLVTDGLVEAGLTYEGAKAFATPRRLALTVQGVSARSPDRREERKGPRVGAPAAALEGFLRGAGLASIDEAHVKSDPKKGEFYVAVLRAPGREAEAIVAELMPRVVRDFPWPKSMRWGVRSGPEGVAGGEGGTALRWVRPLRSILCTFGPETEEPAVVPFEVGGIVSGNVTAGHRFMHGGELIRVRRFDDYAPALERAFVVLDAERRRAIIETESRNLAFAQGMELVEDPALLDEVAGLVEWPVVLMGSFDPAFLAIPDEVIRLTIRANQKCFVLRDLSPSRLAGEGRGGGKAASLSLGTFPPPNPPPQGGRALANRFLLTANIEASDGGAAIVAGNERVIAARLADARFFWEGDLAVPLEAWGAKLAGVTFHEKLGSQADRVERIAGLACELAPVVGADPDLAKRAARLAKADLTTGMVGEFPELQGVMGRYYALAAGEPAAVADAIRDHYRPQGPGDAVPTEPVAVAVALADKLDTLVGFWAIDEKPTGSKDPFALRRAALGLVRIVLENGLRLPLTRPLRQADLLVAGSEAGVSGPSVPDVIKSLLVFFADRLKVYLRETGTRNDLIDAVFAVGASSSPQGGEERVEVGAFPPPRPSPAGGKGGRAGGDDLLLVVRRVEALGVFLETEDGANLLAGYRRAANILRAEEKRDGAGEFDGPPDDALIAVQGSAEEQALSAAMDRVEKEAGEAVLREDFAGAMAALATLRPAVDAFFEEVTVNADDPALRLNRLRLLNRLRRATLAVADFSKIAS